MIRSMTAFAREESQQPWGSLCWELRSVNHRFLEISLRLPEDARSLETSVRELIGRHVRRGKVDCSLRLQAGEETIASARINQAMVARLTEAARQLNHLTGHYDTMSTVELMRWPGVLETPALDTEALKSPLLEHLGAALRQLAAHREREGEQIHALLAQRIEAIAQEVGEMRKRLPEIQQNHRERLLARLNEARQEIDPNRLEQELVLLANKMDVAEELDRLEAHLAETRKTMNMAEPNGRRLDFLMQELSREANTLGAKSVHSAMTMASVNLKVLIEQMREQIQNVE